VHRVVRVKIAPAQHHALEEIETRARSHAPLAGELVR
jgi:hypothetical protein